MELVGVEVSVLLDGVEGITGGGVELFNVSGF